jgi:hypothetical protein
MDEWGWERLRPWLNARAELPVGPLWLVHISSEGLGREDASCQAEGAAMLRWRRTGSSHARVGVTRSLREAARAPSGG